MHRQEMTIKPLLRIRSKVHTKYGHGRDALFLGERLRKEHWRTQQERQDLIVLRQNLERNRQLSEVKGQLEKVEAYQNPMIMPVRLKHLSVARDSLQASLARLGENVGQ